MCCTGTVNNRQLVKGCIGMHEQHINIGCTTKVKQGAAGKKAMPEAAPPFQALHNKKIKKFWAANLIVRKF